MGDHSSFGRVPDSVTFGCRVLQIPTLEEVGIPLPGLGLVKLNAGLESSRYYPDANACWINRGDLLLTYEFRFFESVKKPFFSDPSWQETIKIVSPISGMLLSLRDEQTLAFNMGLQYEGSPERLLPILLVPNDEPPPDADNFYAYDKAANLLSANFYLIPVRDASRTNLERLQTRIDRYGGKSATAYAECHSAIRNRKHDRYRTYQSRELSGADTDLIRMVQHLRAKDLRLREKLVHIARAYGASA